MKCVCHKNAWNPLCPAHPARHCAEVCTSCMKRIELDQEWCKTPQCDTDLRDSNNRIPYEVIGRA